jgi:hypothetical protein
MGAYLAGRCEDAESFLPPSWKARTLAFESARAWALAIDATRQGEMPL